jgi:hypothetical protein
VRVLSLRPDVDASSVILRIGGWAVAGSTPAAVTTSGAAVATGARVRSGIHPLIGDGRPSVETRDEASPLGDHAAVPVLEHPAQVGPWIAAAVELAGADIPETAPPAAAVTTDAVTVTWPDGTVSEHRLPDSGTAIPAHR